MVGGRPSGGIVADPRNTNDGSGVERVLISAGSRGNLRAGSRRWQQCCDIRVGLRGLRVDVRPDVAMAYEFVGHIGGYEGRVYIFDFETAGDRCGAVGLPI